MATNPLSNIPVHEAVNVAREFITIPDWENTTPAGLALAGFIGCAVVANRHFNKTDDQALAKDFRGQTAQAEQSQIGDSKLDRKMKMGPVNKMFAAGGLLTIQLISSPTYEGTVIDRSTEAVVVSDVSNSMRYTVDADNVKTRMETVHDGIFSADFAGSLGLVQSGNESVIITPPTREWQDLETVSREAKASSSASNLGAAIDTAGTLLPPNPETGKRKGTLLIATDTTIDGTTESLANQLKALEESGVNTEVIVVGTPEGKYVLPGTTNEVSAAVNAQSFKDAGIEIIEAKSQDEVMQAISSRLTSLSSRQEQRPWRVPLYLAGILGALAAGQGFIQRVDKRI